MTNQEKAHRVMTGLRQLADEEKAAGRNDRADAVGRVLNELAFESNDFAAKLYDTVLAS
jgi:hypothetical protein